MYTVKAIANTTGLTPRQVYDRLTSLSGLLNGALQTGSRGAKLLTDQGFAVFRRLIDLETEGLCRESAVRIMAAELETPQPDTPKPVRNDRESIGELVETLREVIKDQRQEIAFLRAQVERLTPLALPSPRRGLFALFRRSRAIAAGWPCRQ